ncbi:hypothetical protein HFP51_08500 [Parasphingopyxis sp. CP4]|uniref:Mth938-like domain-containing protein n=1 Tax=Parasphingopyxis sp. CP4 TaxID=2724527 RepID=UPI0015A444D3|nr:MTH938/NDUFAF3 family protein [Parasphingopyxis sp. CP4]QLC22211.1 hypothetical protein HFP51_08500 [Parasphingopyxis sp. CP4]
MASLERDTPAAGPVVTGFAGNAFRLDEEIVAGGLWLTPESARPWDIADMADLKVETLAPLLALAPSPEFLLLGTGARLERPSPAFVSAVEALDIGVEAMDSRAAARAWGMLRSEDRWIVAALLPID